MYVSICVLDDDHRVKLRPLPDHQDCQTDYINASYVDVCELIKNIPELYIPTPSTYYRATPLQTDSYPPKVLL